jgi:hypothetical protein
MAELAWVFGILGGVSFLVGNLVALTVIPEFFGLGWAFWFAESAFLMLISLAFGVAHYGASYS